MISSAVPVGNALAPTTGLLGPAAWDAAEEPLAMEVEILGTPSAEWALRAFGRAQLDAPAAALELRAVHGDAEPLAGSLSSWSRILSLRAGQSFDEFFTISPADEGTVLELTFLYDASPAYALRFRQHVTVERTAAGDLTARAELMPWPTGEPGDAPPMDATSVVPPIVQEIIPQDQIPVDEPTSEVPGAQGTFTVTAYFYFKDPSGAWQTCRYCFVYAYDYDGGGGDDYYGGAETNVNGYWTYTHADIIDEDGTYMDLYARPVANSNEGRVYTTANALYGVTTGVLRWDVPNSATTHIGTFYIDMTGTTSKAFWIHRGIVSGWHEARYGGPATDIGTVIANFPVDGWNSHTAETAEYHPGGNIHLGSNKWGLHTATHEAGHYAHWKTAWPSGTSCTEPRCGAVKEGWAMYWALETWNTATYVYTSGTTVNYEACGGACGSAGDGDYRRVAASLWDLVDSANDGEVADYSTSYTFGALSYGVAYSFHDYYHNWMNRGYSMANFQDAACNNNICYHSH